MSLVIEDAFTVPGPPDAVFALMSDVGQMHACIPGAELLGQRDDESYDLRIGMKVGPLRLSYHAVLEVTDRNMECRQAQMKARATEERGQGTAQATLDMRVSTDDHGGSAVSIRSDMLVTGRVAQMGRGIMVDVSRRMVRDMAEAVRATLELRRAETQPITHSDGAASQVSVVTADNSRWAAGPASVGADAVSAAIAHQPVVTAREPNALRFLVDVILGRLRSLFGNYHR